MHWQKTSYGILIATGLAITGITIYTGSKTTIDPVDMIELYAGVKEREFVLQSSYRLTNDLILTNYVLNPTWVDEPDANLVWNDDLGVHRYKKNTDTNALKSLVSYIPHYAYGGTRTTTKNLLRKTDIIVTNTGERFVWGPYQSLDVINGTNINHYTYLERKTSRYSGEVLDVYKENSTNLWFVSYGQQPNNGFNFSTSRGHYDNSGYFSRVVTCYAVFNDYSKIGLRGYAIDSFIYHASYGNRIIITGGLITNKMRDAFVMKYELVTNAITREISGSMVKNIRTHIKGNNSQFSYIDLAAAYVDTSQTDINENFTNLILRPPSSVPHLNPSIIYSNLGINDIGFSTNTIITTNDFVRTYKYLNQLKWTDNHTVIYTNVGSIVNEWNYSSYRAFSPTYYTWADAKTAAETNPPFIYTNTGKYGNVVFSTRGMAGRVYGTWHFDADMQISKEAFKIEGLNTNVKHLVIFYIASDAFGWGTIYTYKENFDNNGTGLKDNFYIPIYSNYTYDASVVTPMFPEIDGFPTWCVDPLTLNTDNLSNVSVSRGFNVAKVIAVVKWDFNYCTNNIP